MLFINLKVAVKLNKEQKEKIAKDFSDTLSKVTGNLKESTYLVIDEISEKNLILEYKLLQQKAAVSLEETLYYFARD